MSVEKGNKFRNSGMINIKLCKKYDGYLAQVESNILLKATLIIDFEKSPRRMLFPPLSRRTVLAYFDDQPDEDIDADELHEEYVDSAIRYESRLIVFRRISCKSNSKDSMRTSKNRFAKTLELLQASNAEMGDAAFKCISSDDDGHLVRIMRLTSSMNSHE